MVGCHRFTTGMLPRCLQLATGNTISYLLRLVTSPATTTERSNQWLCQGSVRGFGIAHRALQVVVATDLSLPHLPLQRKTLERPPGRKSAIRTWIWWLRVMSSLIVEPVLYTTRCFSLSVSFIHLYSSPPHVSQNDSHLPPNFNPNCSTRALPTIIQNDFGDHKVDILGSAQKVQLSPYCVSEKLLMPSTTPPPRGKCTPLGFS